MRREGDGCAKGSIYSVPKEGVLLFFGYGDSRWRDAFYPRLGRRIIVGRY